MVSGHRPGRCEGGIVIRYHEAVDRIRILAPGDLLRPSVYGVPDRPDIRVLQELPLHRVEAGLLQEIHLLAPCRDVVIRVHETERDPVDPPPLHLLHILQGQGTGCQVPRVGEIPLRFHAELLEIGIRYDRLPADDQMALRRDRPGDVVKTVRQMGYVRTYVPVPSGDYLCQPPSVVRHDKGEAVQLP